jgi:MoaA/NifB/PqqE/SkfB family radical SAM enzyme
MRKKIIPIVPEDLVAIPSEVSRSDRAMWLTKNREKFCILPFINLNTNPDGKIKLCCNVQWDHFVARNKIPLNFGYDDIEEIWKGKYMTDRRQMHFGNTGSRECEVTCYEIEKITGRSPRIGVNELWLQRKDHDPGFSDFLDQTFERDHPAPVEQLPISLEIRFGNQCNLQCIGCWGMSSSLIHEERVQILNKGMLDEPKLKFLKDKFTEDKVAVEKADLRKWYETETFYENFKKMAPLLRSLYTTGGEPTLIKANYKLFQMLLDAKNDWCDIKFTSNMTTWNHDFYCRLEKFKNVEIQMSIDATYELAEYLRYPCEFNKVKDNVWKAVKWASVRPGWKIVCYTVLQAANYKHLPEIWNMLNEVATRYKKPISWWPIVMENPSYLSLGVVPKNDRDEFLVELEDIKVSYDSNEYFKISPHAWDACSSAIANFKYDRELHKQFSSYIRILDKQRKLDGELLLGDLML